MLQITYEVTSEQPCQIPALGEFEAGETKQIDDAQLQQFQAVLGYPLQQGHFASWVKLTAVLSEKED